MNELSVVQMKEISGGTVAANWCGGVSAGITLIGIFNPLVGISAGLMWTAACWWLSP